MNDIWEKYEKLELIGYGGFADVYRAKNKFTHEYVAIKEIKKIKIDYSDKTIQREIEIMKKFKFENTVKFIESFETLNSFYIISELCFMSLEEYMNKRGKGLSIEEIKELLLDLNKGLKEMNENKIIHRDLKPSNILLNINKKRIDKLKFKISDFGLSQLKDEMKSLSSKGTPVTMAPEVIKEELISPKSDIWSLGVIIYYLYFNEYPYNGNEYGIIKQIESNTKIKDINDKELNDLVRKMLNPNIEKRISWNNYFIHPFFKQNKLPLIALNKFPLFKSICNIHSKDYNAYCDNCKKNICKLCLKEHKNHKIILFSEIGLSEKEIKQFDNIIKETEINMNKLTQIISDITNFIDNIKLNNSNISIYENDEKNNFKHYSIECLNIIKEKTKIEGEFNLPKIEKKTIKKKESIKKNILLDKWELR